MKKFNIEYGRRGEEIARKFLLDKGYKHIESNFRLKGGEIDLICSYGNRLIFVEVKLKVGDRFGTPEEMISKRKLYRVRKIAQIYLKMNPDLEGKFPVKRIDAVCIVLNEDGTLERINHYENME